MATKFGPRTNLEIDNAISKKDQKFLVDTIVDDSIRN